MATPQSIYDVREDKIEIAGKPWDDPQVQLLATKQIYTVQKMVDWWQPYLDLGQELYDKYDGEILSAAQQLEYKEVEDKVVIQPPIAKSPIRALLGQVIKARKSGSVAIEDGDVDDPVNPDEISTVNIALKDLEKKTYEHDKFVEAVHDALVSCYPNVLFWHQRKPTGDNPLKYDVDHLPWNSCVFGPLNARGPGMTGIKEFAFFDWRSMADLIDDFPDMEKQIAAHWGSGRVDDKLIANLWNWDMEGQTADDVQYLRGIINSARGNFTTAGGLIPVFQRLFPIRRKEEVWEKVTDEPEGAEFEVLPSTWSDRRKDEWIQANKGKYEGPYERPIVTLWRTVFSSTGLMLSNEKHWYQEYGNLPATFLVPFMQNGKPTGPMKDMAPEVLRNCVAQIEYLDDMRKGGGMTIFTKEGAFARPEDVTYEVNKAKGVVFIKKDFRGSAKDAYNVERHEPSKAWREYGEFAKSDMYENTRLNETMQGEAAPRQAAIAKETEIAQALAVNALYINNFNLAWEMHQNVKLAMLSHIYDESMISIQGYDEEEKVTKATTLNMPEYDQEGEVTNVFNDITSRHYRWKPSPVDDSPTAKIRMMQDALIIMNGAFGPLMQADPSGKFLAKFLSALDNPVLNKMGRALEKDAQIKAEQQSQLEQQQVMQEAQATMVKAQAELEKAKKTGLNMSFTGEQIAQYPALFEIYMNLLQNTGGAPMQGVPQQQPVQQQPVMA